jgi:serine/threonine protein kinase
MTDRLLIAYDIAVAGNYLHKKNIIFRDFKPDNVGFTSVGVTKIMDFGLAREVTNLRRDEDGLYNMTGLTGGIRYMAPEVGLNRPYNTSADIYSWSMIFWYMLALEPPLCLYTPEMIVHRVFEKGHRPAIKVSWNPALAELLRRCWTENVHERLTFQEIINELFVIVRSYDPNVAALMKLPSEQ